jgi:hypothetical protein
MPTQLIATTALRLLDIKSSVLGYLGRKGEEGIDRTHEKRAEERLRKFLETDFQCRQDSLPIPGCAQTTR